ncbi:ORF33 [Ostreid herpesvirus 1]|nr:ORF33 [Ostreid herpesvirus 1]UCX57134.1 ORF33 [Ostreid herpesvirus 1]
MENNAAEIYGKFIINLARYVPPGTMIDTDFRDCMSRQMKLPPLYTSASKNVYDMTKALQNRGLISSKSIDQLFSAMIKYPTLHDVMKNTFVLAEQLLTEEENIASLSLLSLEDKASTPPPKEPTLSETVKELKDLIKTVADEHMKMKREHEAAMKELTLLINNQKQQQQQPVPMPRNSTATRPKNLAIPPRPLTNQYVCEGNKVKYIIKRGQDFVKFFDYIEDDVVKTPKFLYFLKKRFNIDLTNEEARSIHMGLIFQPIYNIDGDVTEIIKMIHDLGELSVYDRLLNEYVDKIVQ